MTKKLLQELKKELEKEKTSLAEQLSTFAKKDPHLKGDWDTKFPDFNGEFGGAALEQAADEVAEYDARLPVEFALELRLRDINLALEKIKKAAKGRRSYGKCEKCGKKIKEKRLKIYPEARLCMKCQKK